MWNDFVGESRRLLSLLAESAIPKPQYAVVYRFDGMRFVDTVRYFFLLFEKRSDSLWKASCLFFVSISLSFVWNDFVGESRRLLSLLAESALPKLR